MQSEELIDHGEPSPRAVKCGRFVVCLVGAILLVVSGAYAYANPQQQLLLTSAVLLAGFGLLWLGIALPAKAAADVGFWLPWFLPG